MERIHRIVNVNEAINENFQFFYVNDYQLLIKRIRNCKITILKVLTENKMLPSLKFAIKFPV